MKNIKIVFFFLLISLCKDTIASQQSQKQRSWYQSFRIANYLPDFIGKRITRWRIQRMFEGTRQYIQRFLKESPSWKKEDEAIAFINEYNQWIDQFYDLVNKQYTRVVPTFKVAHYDFPRSIGDVWRIETTGVQLPIMSKNDFLIRIINNLEEIGGRSDNKEYGGTYYDYGKKHY